MKKEKIEKWYDSGHMITTLMLVIIFLIVICSQSFASDQLSFALLSSIINHNSIYLLVLVYFILIKFPVGKKYFNYLSIFLIFVYLTVAITSLLTVIQSFSLTTVLSFALNFLLFIYISHTLLRGTRFWKEFHLHSSPFNELTNEGIFYAIVVLSVFLLAVNLISTAVIRGVFIAILDTLYYLLLGRYIYLYYEYLDIKKIDSNNEGNFDEVRGKVKEVLDKTEIDDVIIEGYKEVKDSLKETKEKKKEEKEEKVEKPKEKKSTTRKTTKKGE